MSTNKPFTENPPPVLPPRPLTGPLGHPLLTRKNNDTPMVIAFRHIKPSWRNYIDFVDYCARNGDKDCDRFVKIFASLTNKQRFEHKPEQLCDMAQMTPGDLMAAVSKGMWETGSGESKMISAMSHPNLIERTVKLAHKEANFKDRELFFRLSGSLPDRKGNSVMPSVNINLGSTPMPNLPTFSGELESFDEESVSLARRLSPAAAIEVAAAPVPEPETEEPNNGEENEDEAEDGD
ncbi:MAG TPA: hypothetical protein VEL77_15340 [Rugosimonospora sp.]|nr:hypothetical protein [Rugosimonospora sp.]